MRRSNLELEALRNKYQDLYDLAPLGYFTLQPGGLILEANTTACAQLGTQKARVMGRRFGLFVHESSRTHLAAFLKRVFATGKLCRVELRMLRRDGTTFEAQVDAVLAGGLPDNHSGADPDVDSGDMPYARAAVVDITPLKTAQDTISALNATLEERIEARTAQIRELNDELETFVQSVTRDLQTPLRQVSSFAALLRGAAPGSDQAAHYLSEVLGGTERINTLVVALADYFRAGRQRAHFGPVNLERLLAEVKKDLRSQLERARRQLATRPAADRLR